MAIEPAVHSALNTQRKKYKHKQMYNMIARMNQSMIQSIGIVHKEKVNERDPNNQIIWAGAVRPKTAKPKKSKV